MTYKLAIFPLQLVVFPSENLNLHIFEPRYQQLISDAETAGITFCVPTVLNGSILPIATEVSLNKVVKRYPSGEADVSTVGQRVFHLTNYVRKLPQKLYAGADCQELVVDHDEDPKLNAEIVVLARNIYRDLKIERTVNSVENGFNTYDIAHYVGLKLEQEYEFLTLLGARERQRYLLDHLKRIRPALIEGKQIQDRARLNGYFKALMPPEW